jgi:hypothetical protein
MLFITYPRSGVNFITRAMMNQTGLAIHYQHSFDGRQHTEKDVDESEDYIVNIVRDPKESMASWISMQYEGEDNDLIKNGHKKMLKARIIPRYIKMYEKLLSFNNVVFIDYKDFNQIDKLLSKLYKVLQITPITNEPVNKTIVDNKNLELGEDGYLLSSKKTTRYLEILKDIEDQDLSACYDLYHKALARCIKLDN